MHLSDVHQTLTFVSLIGIDIQLGREFAEYPCSVEAFVVHPELHTGARPSVRVCVGLPSGDYTY